MKIYDDITEPCQYYHKYTKEELAAMHPPDPEPDAVATWDELAAEIERAK